MHRGPVSVGSAVLVAAAVGSAVVGSGVVGSSVVGSAVVGSAVVASTVRDVQKNPITFQALLENETPHDFGALRHLARRLTRGWGLFFAPLLFSRDIFRSYQRIIVNFLIRSQPLI